MQMTWKKSAVLFFAIFALGTAFIFSQTFLSKAAPGSIGYGIEGVVLSVFIDNPTIDVVNIGDMVRVEAYVDNTEGDCTTTVTADMTAYGGSTTEAFVCVAPGAPDYYVLDYVVIDDDGGLGGVDGAAVAVTVSITDGDDLVPITAETNPIAGLMDTIAPVVDADDMSVDATGTGTSGEFIVDDVLYVHADTSTMDSIGDFAYATANIEDWGGATDEAMSDDEGCLDFIPDGEYTACYFIPEGFYGEGGFDTVDATLEVTVCDDANNCVTTSNAIAYSIDNIKPSFIGETPIRAMTQELDEIDDYWEEYVPPLTDTNFWFYYNNNDEDIDDDDELILDIETNYSTFDGEIQTDDINNIQVCVKSMATNSPTDVCLDADFLNPAFVAPALFYGENSYDMAYEIPVEIFDQATPNGYSINIQLVDNAGNKYVSNPLEFAEQNFVAIFGMEPKDMDPELDNEFTTVWEDIADFTDVYNLDFAATETEVCDDCEALGTLLAEFELAGPLNLTEEDTLDALFLLGQYMELQADLIGFDSDALSGLDSDAILRVLVSSSGMPNQPGIIVYDNADEVLGYVPNDAVTDEFGVDVGGDAINDFDIFEDPALSDLWYFAFTTTGFSTFGIDSTAPTVTISPSDSGAANPLRSVVLTFSESINEETFDFIDDSGVAYDPAIWNSDSTSVTLNHEAWDIGEVVTFTVSALTEDLVGLAIDGDTDSTFTVRASSSGGSGGATTMPTTSPSIALSAPSSATSGDSVSLSWTSGGAGISEVLLSYGISSEIDRHVIADHLSASGAYSWTIPITVSGDVTVYADGYDSGRARLATNSKSMTVITSEAEQQAQEQAQAEADADAGITRDSENRRIAPLTSEMQVSPITGELEQVSRVSAGMYVRAYGFSTVYYITSDMTRKPFWNAESFFTWADSWDDVIWITNATLVTLPISSPMLPKPEVVLVKIVSEPTVYMIEPSASSGGVLHWIKTEFVAQSMYGANWADYVIDIEPTLFLEYEIGDHVVSPIPIDMTKMKTRAQIANLVIGS
ncbi:TPA: hypothetical protein DCZ32_01350 [Candidatus Uhrbacteria bacterium]|nr:hypothetical protein [Candidatus Uhrbacteria bacterium]